jgi:hypothetical protein
MELLIACEAVGSALFCDEWVMNFDLEVVCGFYGCWREVEDEVVVVMVEMWWLWRLLEFVRVEEVVVES